MLTIKCKTCGSAMDFPRKTDGGIVFGANSLVCTTNCKPAKSNGPAKTIETRKQRRDRLFRHNALAIALQASRLYDAIADENQNFMDDQYAIEEYNDVV
jgi:hypothetical protein